ncbi:MAG: hypothetical protein ABI925_05010 [Verrucomicrobiota bacterium]
MRILTLSTSPHADKSFQVGIGLVVLFAVAELSSASYYYLRRFRVAQPTTQSAAQSVAVAQPTAIPRVAPAPVRATPPPAGVGSPPPAALPRVDRLIQEATAFRSRGDMTNALARLFEAAESEPKNGKVLEEMAKTYETFSLFERSNETWRKIQEMGPSAGPSYDVAVARLKTGAASPPPAVAPTTAPATAAVKPAAAAPPPADAGASPASGSIFSIAQIKASEEPDVDTETNLTLRIAVKKQTSTVIDHTKVKIQVFFYDTVDDKDIKLTDAEVNYEWVTSKHDWAGADPEVLSVNYLRPKNKVITSEAALAAAAASVNPGRKGKPVNPSPPPDNGKRRYLGYIVRVYYHDELQAQKAEPKRLLKLFPAASAATP